MARRKGSVHSKGGVHSKGKLREKSHPVPPVADLDLDVCKEESPVINEMPWAEASEESDDSSDVTSETCGGMPSGVVAENIASSFNSSERMRRYRKEDVLSSDDEDMRRERRGNGRKSASEVTEVVNSTARRSVRQAKTPNSNRREIPSEGKQMGSFRSNRSRESVELVDPRRRKSSSERRSTRERERERHREREREWERRELDKERLARHERRHPSFTDSKRTRQFEVDTSRSSGRPRYTSEAGRDTMARMERDRPSERDFQRAKQVGFDSSMRAYAEDENDEGRHASSNVQEDPRERVLEKGMRSNGRISRGYVSSNPALPSFLRERLEEAGGEELWDEFGEEMMRNSSRRPLRALGEDSTIEERGSRRPLQYISESSSISIVGRFTLSSDFSDPGTPTSPPAPLHAARSPSSSSYSPIAGTGSPSRFIPGEMMRRKRSVDRKGSSEWRLSSDPRLADDGDRRRSLRYDEAQRTTSGDKHREDREAERDCDARAVRTTSSDGWAVRATTGEARAARTTSGDRDGDSGGARRQHSSQSSRFAERSRDDRDGRERQRERDVRRDREARHRERSNRSSQRRAHPEGEPAKSHYDRKPLRGSERHGEVAAATYLAEQYEEKVIDSDDELNDLGVSSRDFDSLEELLSEESKELARKEVARNKRRARQRQDDEKARALRSRTKHTSDGSGVHSHHHASRYLQQSGDTAHVTTSAPQPGVSGQHSSTDVTISAHESAKERQGSVDSEVVAEDDSLDDLLEEDIRLAESESKRSSLRADVHPADVEAIKKKARRARRREKGNNEEDASESDDSSDNRESPSPSSSDSEFSESAEGDDDAADENEQSDTDDELQDVSFSTTRDFCARTLTHVNRYRHISHSRLTEAEISTIAACAAFAQGGDSAINFFFQKLADLSPHLMKQFPHRLSKEMKIQRTLEFLRRFAYLQSNYKDITKEVKQAAFRHRNFPFDDFVHEAHSFGVALMATVDSILSRNQWGPDTKRAFETLFEDAIVEINACMEKDSKAAIASG